MAHNYKDITEEIIKNVGIKQDDVFYYDGTPLEAVFEMYFQFCQENLRIKSSEFDIEPARIFLRNHIGVNAFATKHKDYYVVGINSGTLINLYYFFDNKGDLFDGPDLAFLNSLNKQLTEIDTPISYLMQQFCNQFTYYHELGHLIQKSPDLQNQIEELYFSPGSKCVFTPEKHVYEFDADLYGSEHIAFHILEFWEKQKDEIKTSENLSYLISIGSAAIFSYFLKLMEGYDKMYYSETCHPHPLVRIVYIIDSFIQTIQGNAKAKVDINSNKIVEDTFKILDVLFKADGSKQVEVFMDLFWKEKENINAYIRGNIFSLIAKMPELAYNRVRSQGNISKTS